MVNNCLKNMDTENINNIEIVRRFLSSFRDENFYKYSYNDKLKYQSFSNVIELLADKINELKKAEVLK